MSTEQERKMKKWLWTVIVLMMVAVLAIGCGLTAKTTPVPTDIANVYITMERQGCQDQCPVYTIRIYGTGFAVFEGVEFVKRIGGAQTSVSEEKLKQLISEFQKIDFFSLEDNYEEQAVAGAPTVVTSITIDGQTKTVTHYHGDTSAPEQLTKLEDKIDEILNIDQLIK